ncbi:MAG: hypothetical protein K2X03_18555 [Bryobacteraceae bacterium]|nr:hypothetical protein [Bryobacteraceae bacterium]
MDKTFLLLTLCALAWADDPNKRVAPVNQDSAHVAIRGYDPVAYFTSGQPAKGQSQFEHTWMDAKWLFTSAANRDAFAAAPEKFAPQFGGYCAWAVSNNYTAPVDPTAWKIVDGKLYLNYNADVQKKWAEGMAERIEKGHQNWPKLHR